MLRGFPLVELSGSVRSAEHVVRVLALEGLGLVLWGVRLKAWYEVPSCFESHHQGGLSHTARCRVCEPHVSLVKGQGPLG